jgi:hypothetical protein
MLDTVGEKLKAVRIQLAPLLKRKKELDDEVRMLIPLRRNVVGDDKFNEIQAELGPLNGEIALLRQEEVSLLTERLGEITERLDSSVQTLDKSSEAQLKVTGRLESSSDRVVFLTGFLILLTTISLMDTFLNYSTPASPAQHAFLGIVIAVTLVLMAVYWGLVVLPSVFKRKE